MNFLKKLLTLILLFFFMFESFSQIKVEFKNGNTFDVSTVVFTNKDILLDLSPNVISKFGKLEIISVKYPDGKKLNGSSIASIVSSDEEIKKMDEKLAEQKIMDEKLAEQKIMDEINNAKPLKYEDIINVPNTEKKKIYLRSRIWFHKTFVNDKAVLSFSDFENGILIGSGIFRAFIGGYVKFSIRIYIKDNNYKYVIDGLVHDDVYIKQGTTIDESMGLLTASKDAPFSTTRTVLAGEALLEKLKFHVDVTIKTLANSLKNAILYDTEADF